jgi:hypothetical protein
VAVFLAIVLGALLGVVPWRLDPRR